MSEDDKNYVYVVWWQYGDKSGMGLVRAFEDQGVAGRVRRADGRAWRPIPRITTATRCNAMPTDKCVSHSYTAAELAILLKKQAAERFPKPHNGAAIFHWDCWERAVEGTLEWQAAEFLMRQVGPSVPLEPTKAMLEAAGEAYFSGRPRPILQVCQAVLDIINGTPATDGGNK
jgi:hypothetical protein